MNRELKNSDRENFSKFGMFEIRQRIEK